MNQYSDFTDGQGCANISLEKLIPSRPDNLLQVNIRIVAPGGKTDERIVHKGQEFGFVIEGNLKLFVGDKKYHLEEGDAFIFGSDLPHGYCNDGKYAA